jgi:hypothetical protein
MMDWHFGMFAVDGFRRGSIGECGSYSQKVCTIRGNSAMASNQELQ